MSASQNPSPNTPAQSDGRGFRANLAVGCALASWLFAGLISCAMLLFSGQIEMMPPHLDQNAVLHGEVTRKIAKQLAGAWLPEQAANLERAASWLVFHDTGLRVRQGCPDWLFLNDEFQINRHAQINADTKAKVVADIQQRLSRQGIRLLVVLVPDKSRIATTQLCGLVRPAELAPRVLDWVMSLHQAGVPVLDLTPVLQALGASAYLRTDTHWNETGAGAAAKAVAWQVRVMGIQAVPQKTFDVHADMAALRPGDLVHLAGIDWLPLRWQPKPELVAATRISERQVTAHGDSDSLDDLLDDASLPNIALIGTSFSRNSNFLNFLELALGAQIGSFAKDGGAFSGSANAYFSNPAFKQTPPKLVIWEIPERDIQTPYESIIWDYESKPFNAVTLKQKV